GMVAPQAESTGPGPLLRFGIASRARYGEWTEALAAESGIDVEYRTDGIVYVALTASDARVLAARARWQRAAGLRVERLRDARRLVRALSPRVRMALHFPDDHRVNNERLVTALAVAARRAGAEVMERTPVRAVRARRDKVEGVDTGAGPIDAPVVVDAAGAWAGALGLPPGVSPPPVFPVRGQILVLRGGLDTIPRPLYSLRGYVVPRVDGRVLAGSTLEDAGYEKRVTAGAAPDILAAACATSARAARRTFTAVATVRSTSPVATTTAASRMHSEWRTRRRGTFATTSGRRRTVQPQQRRARRGRVSTRSSRSGEPELALIRADDLGLGQDMPLDGLQQRLLRGAGIETRRRVERVELEEVAMRLPGRGAGATVAHLPEVVHALAGAAREILVGWHAFAQLARGGRDVVDHPVDPRAGGGVGIVADEREHLRVGRRVAPAERRRHV